MFGANPYQSFAGKDPNAMLKETLDRLTKDNEALKSQAQIQQQQEQEQVVNADKQALATFSALYPKIGELDDCIKTKVKWASLLSDLPALAWITTNFKSGSMSSVNAIPFNVGDKIKWAELCADEKSFAIVKNILPIITNSASVQQTNQQSQNQQNQQNTQNQKSGNQNNNSNK